MTGLPINKNKFASIFIVYFLINLIPQNPLIASQSRDFLVIDKLVKNCYRNINSCNNALNKINNYQKNAATNKKFSCQTRLLGLEANLIMAMNSNLRKNEAKSIIQTLKKYC